MRPRGYSHTASPSLAASKGKKNKKKQKHILVSHPLLHSLSLNCTWLMSWHLFFQFSQPPHSSTSPPYPRLLFLLCLFILHPVYFLLAFTMLQKGLRKRTMLCYQETFFGPQHFTFTVPYSIPRVWDRQGQKESQCSPTNSWVNKRTLLKLGFADLGTCKNDIKQHILHFNLSTRIVLIRSHHLNMNSFCCRIVRQMERKALIK